MASLRILVPDGTTNYIKNPSLRFDTTGYTSVGSTLSRSLERARFGLASLKIVTNGSAIGEGFYYRLTWLSGIQSPLTASVYLRGAGKVRLRLVDVTGGNNYASKAISLNDSRWTRLDVSGRRSGGDDIRVYVETADSTARVVTFYTDGLQLEPKEYPTTYCDGDQMDCYWNILQNGSISTRSPYTRAGGRWVELADCSRPESNLYMTVLGGFGVAPISNNIQSYADAPGSFYQNTKVLNRAITISFHVKSPDLRGNREKSLRDLHALRKALFDIVRPDKTAGGQEFILEYQDGDFQVYVGARYEAGLEGEWDIRNRWKQSFPVRFLAVSPFIWDDNYETVALNFKTRDTINYAIRRFSGEWSGMNGGMNNLIYSMAIGKRGELIAVGAFTRSNNPQIYTNFVAYWDGSAWQPFGTGVNVGTVINDVAVAPNGDVYVVGSFTTIGGVACNNIAKWNGTTWAALGTGLGASGFAVRVAPNGDVYAGGSFLTAGGSTARYFAKWNGAGWIGVGSVLGLNNPVYSIDITPDGTSVFLGGSFTDEFGSPAILALNYVAEYLPDFNQFFEVGDGFDALVRKIFIAPSGQLYAAGDFANSGLQGMAYIAYWDGASWHDLGLGANNTVRNLDVDTFGNVLAVGDFTRIGSVDAQGVALFNGTTWVNLDVYPLASGYAIKWGANGDIFFSPNATLSDFSAITTISVTGTAEVSPLLYVAGPCTLRWIENQTAQKRIYIDLDILNGEEVIFDFGTGKVISMVRGDLSYAIAAGSDLRSWTLFPGTNRIAVLAINDISAVIRLYYAPRHWSVDAMVNEVGL